ncbi:MAG: hypothetical protein Q9212_006678 [Teloschistes hypoglaucus]
MRLIDTCTLTLQEFNEVDISPYAILSHTWGEGEVSFQDFEKPSSRTLTGYTKITKCCEVARSDGWQYVWVDTCCIDKTSSAELSEAINSMYRWYQEAQVCYVYMVDVKSGSDEEFQASRWFQRGWTLQELLAPYNAIFYDRNWEEVGTKSSLESLVSAATSIATTHLKNPTEASVAAKMSWAAKRKTTRTEDIAYCLMGLFDVNMPLLYGEGKKAFQRLQEMILRKTSDESIFAWKDPNPFSRESRLFALSPEPTNCQQLETWDSEHVGSMDGSPFMSRTVYIEISSPLPYDNPNAFTQSCDFLLKLSPPHHGFALVASADFGFSYLSAYRLQPREDLGGWQIAIDRGSFTRAESAVFFLFRQSDGESFILKWELNRGTQHPTIQICVPKESETSDESKATHVNVEAMKAYFGTRTGADRLTGCLQHGTPVTGSVRKKPIDGKISYITEIQFFPRSDRTALPPMHGDALSPSPLVFSKKMFSGKRKRAPYHIRALDMDF